jgi:hypothetical protein
MCHFAVANNTLSWSWWSLVTPMHVVIVLLNTFMASDILLVSSHLPRNTWYLKSCLPLNTRGWDFHQPSVNGEGDGLSGLVLDVCVGHVMQVVVIMSSAFCCEEHSELIEQEVTKALEISLPQHQQWW